MPRLQGWTASVQRLPIDERRIAALLRLVGRLEFVPGPWLRAAIFSDVARSTAALHLQRLHAHKLIWQHTIPPSRIPRSMYLASGALPRHAPVLYGLTEQGRNWLDARGDDPATLATFVVRDWKEPDVRAAQLAHDLMVVQWCLSALTVSARSRWLLDARCQVEYVSLVDEGGQAVQRFDALLVLTLLPQRERMLRPIWEIPWGDGAPAPDGARVLRVALEADRGTEKLAILLGKGVMYRNLTLLGHYEALFGGPVTPVIICPTSRRAAQIGREWFDAWPGGRGIVSTTRSAYDEHLGVLGGTYLSMTDIPARPVSLLAELGIERDAWAASLHHS